MSKTLLDTDILSEVFKERNAVVLACARRYVRSHRVPTFASVSMVEMLSGLYARDAKSQLASAEAFLACHDQIVPQPEDYKLSAKIIGTLVQQGRPIGKEDPLIAACAINRNLPLATGNTRHYQYVVDAGFAMTLENWRGF